jgi:Zn-dependent protease/CBS domain-containing protein
LLSVRGIPIRLHWSLLLALPYVALAFVAHLVRRSDGALTQAQAWLLGMVLAVGLFAGVALHEMAHAFVGRRLGAAVRSITLMFLGGVSELSAPPRRPGGEALTAAAGPAVSLALGALFWSAARLTRGLPADALALFGHVNVAIGVFNLLPAFPLDGGRLLRGALAPRLGAVRATRAAARVGQVFAVLMGLTGLLTMNLLLALIGVFVYLSAAGEAAMTEAEARLGGIPVTHFLDPGAVTVGAGESLAEAGARMAATRQPLLVVTDGGRVVGQLPAARVRAVPAGNRALTPVAAAMLATPRVAPGEMAVEALRRMGESGVDAIPVLDGDRLLGLVRREDLMRSLSLRDLGER